MFVIPWGERTYVGTTDTTFDGALDDPRCTDDDVRYLLGALDAVTTVDVRAERRGRDVGGRATAPARLRPRAHRRPLPPALGRHVAERRGDGHRRQAHHLPAHGRRRGRRGAAIMPRRTPRRAGPSGCAWSAARASPTPRAHLDPPGHRTPSRAEHLRSRYGTEAGAIDRLVRDTPEWGDALVPGLPYLRAEAVFAVRDEMARSLDDVLARRTRALILDRDATAAAAPAVAALLAPELGWSAADVTAELARFAEIVATDSP